MNIILDEYYISCMNCENKNCKDVWNNKSDGIPPRGFYYLQQNIKILVVAKNPGHPIDGESEKYKGLTGKELFYAYRERQNAFYYQLENEKNRSSRFHKNLFRYLSYFLDIENKPSEIYKSVAHTNLVKCSTYDEQAKLSKNTMEECYTKHFLKEIEYFNPSLILALGREVEHFLKYRKELDIPIIEIKHPSYFYRKDDEKRILAEKKNEISQYIEKDI
jgi:uracil-DNA glycosylase